MINLLDTLRALAGIVASKEMDEEIRTNAKGMMIKIMEILNKHIDMEAQMTKKASAEMNGIIS